MIVDLALDDALLELTKIALIRNGMGTALANGVELRLVREKGVELEFCWINAIEERVVDQFSLPRQYYEDIANAPELWGELGDKIGLAPFVDMQKMLYTSADLTPAVSPELEES